jgi:hypothetical protein
VLVEVDVRPSLLESPEAIVRDFQDAQDSLEFPLAPGVQCVRCGFHGALCDGAPPQ